MHPTVVGHALCVLATDLETCCAGTKRLDGAKARRRYFWMAPKVPKSDRAPWMGAQPSHAVMALSINAIAAGCGVRRERRARTSFLDLMTGASLSGRGR